MYGGLIVSNNGIYLSITFVQFNPRVDVPILQLIAITIQIIIVLASMTWSMITPPSHDIE
jgi:hypothetical protein